MTQHTPWPRGWDFYYVPRSSLNPHGTYAIVEAGEMNIDKSVRSHIAEVSGFGDGSPEKRKTPDVVHLIAAAPELVEKLKNTCDALQFAINNWSEDDPFRQKAVVTLEAARAFLATLEGK